MEVSKVSLFGFPDTDGFCVEVVECPRNLFGLISSLLFRYAMKKGELDLIFSTCTSGPEGKATYQYTSCGYSNIERKIVRNSRTREFILGFCKEFSEYSMESTYGRYFSDEESLADVKVFCGLLMRHILSDDKVLVNHYREPEAFPPSN